MKTPHVFAAVPLPAKVPAKIVPVPLASLPMLGYMEKTCSMVITKALTDVGLVRPKYPYLTAEQSALLHMAMALKAFNPKNSQ